MLDKLQFNIIDIIHNIANNKEVTAYPSATSTIFDPVSEKLYPVSPLIAEVLALCDGRKSVQQISHELSSKHNTERSTIEEDCISFLNFLSRQGYIIF